MDISKHRGAETEYLDFVGPHLSVDWRLQARLAELLSQKIIISIFRMNAAPPTVLGELVHYGTTRDAETGQACR